MPKHYLSVKPYSLAVIVPAAQFGSPTAFRHWCPEDAVFPSTIPKHR